MPVITVKKEKGKDHLLLDPVGIPVKTVSQKLYLVQLLRGIASLLVLLKHTTVLVKVKMGSFFLGGIFAFGGSGVDIFFVLSGFIITYTSMKALNNPSNFVGFLRRRFIRIFIVYWIITSIFLLLQQLLPSFYNSLYEYSIFNVLSTYLLLPEHTMVNGVSWSLSNEVFFYFLFSLAFIIRQKRLLWILSAAYLLLLIILPLSGFNPETSNKWIRLAIMPMNIDFFMGILAALVIPKLPSRFSIPLIILGIVLFVVSAIYFSNGNSMENYFRRVLLFGIPSFLIITGIVSYELNKMVKVPGILVSLGEASYSLYLLHLPVMAAGVGILAKLNLQAGMAIHAAVIVLLIGVCLGSILFFKWIEKPLISRLNRTGTKLKI